METVTPCTTVAQAENPSVGSGMTEVRLSAYLTNDFEDGRFLTFSRGDPVLRNPHQAKKIAELRVRRLWSGHDTNYQGAGVTNQEPAAARAEQWYKRGLAPREELQCLLRRMIAKQVMCLAVFT